MRQSSLAVKNHSRPRFPHMLNKGEDGDGDCPSETGLL